MIQCDEIFVKVSHSDQIAQCQLEKNHKGAHSVTYTWDATTTNSESEN